MAAILIAAAAVRLVQLGTESLWFDEAYSIQLAARPVARILSERWIDIHPPLYYLLLHLWVSMAGTSEIAARLLSVGFDVGAIAAAAVAGARLLGPRAGLIAAVLLAASPFRVEYAQESRMYALLALLSTASMGAFAEIILTPAVRGRPDVPVVRVQVVYAIATALMLYTHAYAVFVLGAQATTLLVLRGGWPDLFAVAWRRLLWPAITIGVLFAPWLVTLADQVARVQGAFWISRPSWIAALEPFEAYAGSSALLVVCATLAVAGRWRGRTRTPPSPGGASPDVILVPWLLAPVLAPFILSQISAPIFLPKYTIAASAPFALLVAAGIAGVPTRLARIAIVATLLLSLVPTYQTYFTTAHKDGWRRAAAELESVAQPGDLVVFYPWYNQVPFDYYHHRDDIRRQPLVPDIHTVIPSLEDIPAAVHRVAGESRLWFVSLQGTPRLDAISSALARSMQEVDHTVGQHVEIWKFERK